MLVFFYTKRVWGPTLSNETYSKRVWRTGDRGEVITMVLTSLVPFRDSDADGTKRWARLLDSSIRRFCFEKSQIDKVELIQIKSKRM